MLYTKSNPYYIGAIRSARELGASCRPTLSFDLKSHFESKLFLCTVLIDLLAGSF